MLRPYQARCGLPAGCALAVDLLDCFLSRVLGRASIREISVRKYVDDLVLYATGTQCGGSLLLAFKSVKQETEQAGMLLNAKKTKVVVNGKVASLSAGPGWAGVCRRLSLRCVTWGWTSSGRPAATLSSALESEPSLSPCAGSNFLGCLSRPKRELWLRFGRKG
eukprot:4850994-Amphidinium_carterae.1